MFRNIIFRTLDTTCQTRNSLVAVVVVVVVRETCCVDLNPLTRQVTRKSPRAFDVSCNGRTRRFVLVRSIPRGQPRRIIVSDIAVEPRFPQTKDVPRMRSASRGNWLELATWTSEDGELLWKRSSR